METVKKQEIMSQIESKLKQMVPETELDLWDILKDEGIQDVIILLTKNNQVSKEYWKAIYRGKVNSIGGH